MDKSDQVYYAKNIDAVKLEWVKERVQLGNYKIAKTKIDKNTIGERAAYYGSLEAYIKLMGFDIKHLIRDAREDWGDDGGYIVCVSKKGRLWYTHFIYVSYNLDCRDYDLSLRSNEEYRCISKKHSSYEYAVKYVEWMADEMKNFSSGFKTNAPSKIVAILKRPFREYIKMNYCKMRHIGELEYKPNYILLGNNIYESVWIYDENDEELVL